MEVILGFLAAVLAPLSAELILTAIISGLFFGAIYSYGLKRSKEGIYDGLSMGIGFLIFLFIWKSLTAFLTGAVLANPVGWLGIALLWSTFCLFVWIGRTVRERNDKS